MQPSSVMQKKDVFFALETLCGNYTVESKMTGLV